MFSTLPTRSGFVTKRALYFIRLYAQQPGRILKKLSEKNPARTYSEILVAYAWRPFYDKFRLPKGNFEKI